MTEKKTGLIQTDFKGLIELLAMNLYPQADMFIRELIQNAHDAVIKRETLQAGVPSGRINITVDRESKTIAFEDNGSGMTADEIVKDLATIGHGGTGELRKQLQEKDRDRAQKLIGQFGIGILSAFVVAERLVVETRSISNNQQGWRWNIEGLNPRWEMEPIEKDSHGTIVTVYLKQEYLWVTNPDKLKSSIRKYADFLPFPIYINGQGPVNTMHAPWHRTYITNAEREKEYRAWVVDRFESSDLPLEIIPIDLDSPYTIKGVIYISDRHIPDINMAGMIDIYQSRMFICAGDRNLLPLWAKFVRGVIDSPDLKPTAARDAVQQDEVHNKIREILGRLIIEAIKRISIEDKSRFVRLMKWHQYHIKGMAIQFDDFFEAIADMVPFEINIKEAGVQSFRMVTLHDYCAMQHENDDKGRKIIYFISEYGAAPQFYRLCQAKGILAINAGLVFEEEFLHKYAHKHSEQIALKRVDIAEGTIIFEPLSDNERNEYLDIEYRLQVKLRQSLPEQEIKIHMDRFLPPEIPAVLTQTKEIDISHKLKQLADNPILSSEMRESMLEALGIQQNRLKPAVLHLNAANPLIKQLCSKNFDEPLIQDAWTMVYNNAFLDSQQFFSIQNIEALHGQTVRALENIIGLYNKVRQLEDQLQKEQTHQVLSQTDHTSLFVMTPFAKEYDLLEEALRQVFELDPYYFQIILARDRTCNSKLFENVKMHMSLVHGFIADVSDLNPNVMLELGITEIDSETRPVIILHREGGLKPPVDLTDRIYIEYKDSHGSPEQLAEYLQEKFRRVDSIDKLLRERKKRYLSVTLIRSQCGEEHITKNEAELVNKKFQTVEKLEKADTNEITKAGVIKQVAALIKTAFEKP